MIHPQELTSKYLLILGQLNERKGKELTNQFLAECFDSDRKTIGNYINGKKINFDFLYAYAEILGLEIELFTKKLKTNDTSKGEVLQGDWKGEKFWLQ